MTFSANQQHVVNVGWLQIFTICNGTSDTSINNQAGVSPLSIDQEEELETNDRRKYAKPHTSNCRDRAFVQKCCFHVEIFGKWLI